jgi:transcriptional repressor NrdR
MIISWNVRTFHEKKEIIMQATKRDGTTEAFMPEKVVVSIVKSGAPYKDARSIAEALSNLSQERMETSGIRDFVHSRLWSMGHESSVERWATYEAEMKTGRSRTAAARASVMH